nr:hypothetical protein [Tanacetum cinerariifolium]
MLKLYKSNIQSLTVRDELVMLWSLVKERFSSTEPTDDKERTLWVELKRLFEPDTNDALWKLQRVEVSTAEVELGLQCKLNTAERVNTADERLQLLKR